MKFYDTIDNIEHVKNLIPGKILEEISIVKHQGEIDFDLIWLQTIELISNYDDIKDIELYCEQCGFNYSALLYDIKIFSLFSIYHSLELKKVKVYNLTQISKIAGISQNDNSSYNTFFKKFTEMFNEVYLGPKYYEKNMYYNYSISMSNIKKVNNSYRVTYRNPWFIYVFSIFWSICPCHDKNMLGMTYDKIIQFMSEIYTKSTNKEYIEKTLDFYEAERMFGFQLMNTISQYLKENYDLNTLNENISEPIRIFSSLAKLPLVFSRHKLIRDLHINNNQNKYIYAEALVNILQQYLIPLIHNIFSFIMLRQSQYIEAELTSDLKSYLTSSLMHNYSQDIDISVTSKLEEYRIPEPLQINISNLIFNAGSPSYSAKNPTLEHFYSEYSKQSISNFIDASNYFNGFPFNSIYYSYKNYSKRNLCMNTQQKMQEEHRRIITDK